MKTTENKFGAKTNESLNFIEHCKSHFHSQTYTNVSFRDVYFCLSLLLVHSVSHSYSVFFNKAYKQKSRLHHRVLRNVLMYMDEYVAFCLQSNRFEMKINTQIHTYAKRVTSN